MYYGDGLSSRRESASASRPTPPESRWVVDTTDSDSEPSPAEPVVGGGGGGGGGAAPRRTPPKRARRRRHAIPVATPRVPSLDGRCSSPLPLDDRAERTEPETGAVRLTSADGRHPLWRRTPPALPEVHGSMSQLHGGTAPVVAMRYVVPALQPVAVFAVEMKAGSLMAFYQTCRLLDRQHGIVVALHAVVSCQYGAAVVDECVPCMGCM